MRWTRARLVAAVALAIAAPGAASALEWIRRESGRDWELACSEEGSKASRVCTVRTSVGTPSGDGPGCSFDVVVLPRRSVLHLACERDVEGVGVVVENGPTAFLPHPDGAGRVVEGGSPQLLDAVITALKLERRTVTLEIRPVGEEPVPVVLGSKDFDRMYGQALVVSDQIL